MTLQQKMILSIGGIFTVLLLFLEVLGYFGARAFLTREIESEGILLARYQADRVKATLNYAETVGSTILQTLIFSDIENDSDRFQSLLFRLLEGNPQISSIEIRGLSAGDTAVRRTIDDEIRSATPVFPTSSISNWAEGQDLYPGIWRIPLADSQITHVHYIVIYDGLMVVVEIPVRLLVAPLERPEGGSAYGFLATRNTVLFASSLVPKASTNERSDFNAQVLLGGDDSKFYRIREPFHGKPAWVGISPVNGLELTVGVVYLEEDNFRHLYGLAWGSALITIVGLGLLMLALSFLARSISRPLVELSAAVELMGKSNFRERVAAPKSATREIKGLTSSFNSMLDDLQGYLEQLKEAVVARQTLDSELAIAAKIQDSILPKFPYTSKHCKADGFSRAARKVGGDFVSVFPVSDDRVGFLVGDVSGKGIPGAIYMAFTASLLEHLGRLGLPPKDCLEVVNKALCEREETTMFATVFFGVLDGDGSVTFANAGHHPPVRYGGAQGVQVPEVHSGLALGVLSDFQFEEQRLQVETGECLFLYTDGITEAMNSEREEFGEERLFELLKSLSSREPLYKHLETIEREVQRFRKETPPNDDVTLLIVTRSEN